MQLGAVTLAECGENSQFNTLLQMLAAVTSFGISGDQLVFVVDGGATTMSFNNAGPAAPPEVQSEPPPFAGYIWYWQATNFTNGTPILVSNPSVYSLRFLSDGTLEGRAAAIHSLEAILLRISLTIQLGPMTLAACPEGSLDSDFLSNNSPRLQLIQYKVRASSWIWSMQPGTWFSTSSHSP